MDNLAERLQDQRAELLAELLAQPSADRAAVEARVQKLKEVSEELELVAAAAAPVDPATANPNAAVLTDDFYASYLLVLLLSKNLYVCFVHAVLLYEGHVLIAVCVDLAQKRRAVLVETHRAGNQTESRDAAGRVSPADQVIRPKPLGHGRRGAATTVELEQLDTLSKSVLHLEQNTVLKLP
ncbi:hypothetical protein BBJ28_00026200 [Nothophytophthora sp. Chile5]|nr:hypothetical protein BBJ28_00026200 [Nothophytophthora sp. Chile5]